MDPDISLKAIELGPLETNTYIVYSRSARQAFIIDPAWDAREITSFVESQNLKPINVLLTHAHADHIGALDAVCAKYGIKFYAHKDALAMLKSPELNLSKGLGMEISVKSDGAVVDETGSFYLNKTKFGVIETPGHAPGGISIYTQGAVFTGDTLFSGSIGRYDLPGSDARKLAVSLKKLLALPEGTAVYPGHGPATTIADEKRNNIYLEELISG